MREKMGALIQFLAVIAAFVLMLIGIGAAYQGYFANTDLTIGERIAEASFYLVIAAIGAGVGIGGVVFGNILKK